MRKTDRFRDYPRDAKRGPAAKARTVARKRERAAKRAIRGER